MNTHVQYTSTTMTIIATVVRYSMRFVASVFPSLRNNRGWTLLHWQMIECANTGSIPSVARR